MLETAFITVLGQILLPALLIRSLGLRDGAGRLEWTLRCLAAAAYLALIAAAGVWLIVPWPFIFFWVVLGAGAALRSGRGLKAARPRSGTDRWRTWRIAMLAAGTLVCSIALGAALYGRRPPGTEAVEISSPLGRGSYYVVNGGYSILINPHLKTLNTPALGRYRAQSYALDIVKVDALGLRADGIWPGELGRYAIFGEPVAAPCDGAVVRTEGRLPDRVPPESDPEHPAGNFVFLDCGGNGVLLAHLQRGSIAVKPGDRLRKGEIVGRVGNSGYTTEPHLHLHAQELKRGDDFLSAEPLPLRIDGRDLARQSRFSCR
jgi:hypothetical protein